MIAIHDYSEESAICNIMLQNIAMEFSKQLSTHFVESVEFPILMKQINKYYIDKKDKRFIWIIGHDLTYEAYNTLDFIVDQNCKSKFIYVHSVTDKKQTHMLENLSQHKNFKYLSPKELFSDQELLYNFMEEKNYKTHNIIDLIDSFNDYHSFGEDYETGYKLKLLFDELGFYHFKENFIYGEIRDGLLERADIIIERKQNQIKRLVKKGSIQKDDKGILAITEDNMLEDLVYMSKQKKNVVNMISSNKIKVYTENIQEFMDMITVERFFSAEILNVSIKGNYATINIKDKIKYESVLSILQYIHSEF